MLDKLLPFLLNLATEGRTWQEQNITASMVIKHNSFVQEIAPEIHKWMMCELDKAVTNSWLECA